jgi:hypothetical protein
MTEIRTRETSHGGRSVDISKGGSNYSNKTSYVPSSAHYSTKPEAIKKPVNTDLPNTQKATQKAIEVNRVAKRLGWVNTNNTDETIKILSKEAESMKENVYQYLESLVRLSKKYCFENNPDCNKCTMREGCKYHASFNKKVGFFKRK